MPRARSSVGRSLPLWLVHWVDRDPIGLLRSARGKKGGSGLHRSSTRTLCEGGRSPGRQRGRLARRRQHSRLSGGFGILFFFRLKYENAFRPQTLQDPLSSTHSRHALSSQDLLAP